jgi:cation diffusion facilitator CzcD-associated flavoprotein CzcO
MNSRLPDRHSPNLISPAPLSDAAERLRLLAQRAGEERALLDFPQRPWVLPRRSENGEPVLNVLVVGAGQAGLAITFGLMRDHVDNILCIDAMPEGHEGPWLSHARMQTLRTPKQLTGPDLGLPSLTFKAWYEAQFGDDVWRDLDQIPRTEWARYLQWIRQVLNLPVRNNVALKLIVPQENYLAAEVETSTGAKLLLCRKLVLATGIEGGGRWYLPSLLRSLPKRFWAHASEAVDFQALQGKRVAVLGAAATAMDNAAAALEHGASEVEQYCRRACVQSIQPYRWSAFPGFMRHIGEVDDLWRWRFLTYFLELREPFTKDAWSRVSRFANYRMVTGTPWDRLSLEEGGIVIHTPGGQRGTDYIIAGTGVEVDHRLRSELSYFADQIATWNDRFQPPPGEENPRLGLYPYLSPSFAFLEREAGAAPALRNIHCFNFGSTLSFGPSGAAIRPMKYLVPKIVRSLTRDLFRDDLDAHWQSFRTFRGHDFEGFPETLGTES